MTEYSSEISPQALQAQQTEPESKPEPRLETVEPEPKPTELRLKDP